MVIAALILGVAIVFGSFMISSSVEKGAQELRTAFTALQDSLVKLADSDSRRPSPARPSRPGRPDPSKNYRVAVGDAPTKGPKSAAIKIVEWSDFQ